MRVEVSGEGARLLIEYLTTEASEGERRAMLGRLFQEPDFVTWLEAYSPHIPEVRSSLFEVLLDLEEPPPEKEPRVFYEKQRRGFISAREMGRGGMMRRLDAAMGLDAEELNRLVNRYLPPGTPLDVDVYLTVDGYNQGMMREKGIFMSVLRIDPDALSVRGVAHEAHHAGVLHWFRKDDKWARWMSEEGSPHRIAAELLIYVLGEGIANRLITPGAVSPSEEPLDERGERRNERVLTLGESYPELLGRIEGVVSLALEGDIEGSRGMYKDFTVDWSGLGIPAGHYASARMLGEIIQEKGEGIVTELILDPWQLFAVYNRLEKKTRRFSKEFVDFYLEE